MPHATQRRGFHSKLTPSCPEHPKTAADAIDEKYSKDRKDRNSNYKGKRDNLHKGRNTWNYNSPRDKFDRRNVKSRYDDQEKTDDPAQIRKQVEFYFSDGNLRQDKFLFEQIGGAANKPVDIKVIASFKRMQRFEPYSAIVKALKESSTLDVLNDDKPNGEQVRRKTPLPETMGTDHKQVAADYNTESMKRSIYAKGFGAEDSKTQLRIEELFSIWGVTSVRLRRHADGTFKGSAFIEFPSEDEAQQFLESDAESKPKWNETEVLSIMSKAEYCQMKDKLINEGKIRRNDLDGDDGPRGGFRGGPRGRARGGRWNGNNGGDRGGRYHNKRRRDDSRSRSGERDLENENWRELREKDKAGRKRDKETKQEFDEA